MTYQATVNNLVAGGLDDRELRDGQFHPRGEDPPRPA